MSNPIRTLAWGGYRNGRIPLSAMYIERGERFEPTAGHYLDELERAFAKVWGYPAIILEGYRSLARQRALYAKWVAGTGNLAALPGTSNHGWGRAADFASHINVYGTPQKDWMNAHAPAYGWHPAGDDFRPREAWHFEYWSGTATASIGAKPLPQAPEPPTNEDDMTQIKYYYKTDAPQTEYGIYGMELPGGYRVSTMTETGSAWGRLYGKDSGAPWLKLSGVQWVKLQAEMKAINADWVVQQKLINGTK